MKLDVIKLAHESGMVVVDDYYIVAEKPTLERFATLVIDKCAKACQDDESGRDGGGYFAEIIRDLKESE